MHHAKEAHDLKNPPRHAFVLPQEGRLAQLLKETLPEAYFSEEHQEWRIDWDPKAFPVQGQKIEAFANEHGLEIFHRYK